MHSDFKLYRDVMKKDIVIIGGGIIGVCTAYFLWKEGRSVTVIDKGEIGKECSYGNAGYITPSHFIPLSAPGMISKGIKWMMNPESPFYIKPHFDVEFIKWLWKFNSYCTNKHVQHVQKTILELNLESMKLYNEMSNIDDLDFQYSENGLLMLFNTEKGLSEEYSVINEANKLGLKARILSKEEIKEKEPNINFDIIGGSFFPEDGHIHPYEFVSSLTSFLKKNGVEFLEHSEVIDLDIFGNHISSIQTNTTNISANEFVLATGSWSPILAKKLNITIPIQAGKGYSFTLDNPFGKIDTPFIFAEAKVAATPLTNKIRFGGTMELAGLTEGINQRRVNGIIKSIKKYIPSFDESSIDRNNIWYGYRPCSPDGVPIVGRTEKFNNLTIATGHAMMGLSLGPITGKLVSETICNKSEKYLNYLSPNRF